MRDLHAWTLSSDLPLVVLRSNESEDWISPGVIEAVQAEIDKNFLVGNTLHHLLEQAKVAEGVLSPGHRGDLRCWLTPSLCAQHELTSVKQYTRLAMAYCKELGSAIGAMSGSSHPFLNGEFSVQLGFYVSIDMHAHPHMH